MSERTGLKRTLTWLYEGVGGPPAAFRWAMLVFDVVTIGYFLVSPFVPHEGAHYWLDYVIGTVIALDLLARFWIAIDRRRFFLRIMNVADLLVVVSMFAPLVSQNYAFLRIIRAVRIARALAFLREESPLAKYLQNRRVLFERVVNLLVFLFVMSALVYADQINRSPDVKNYLDAFYFTVTSLTTTGYGDISLVGPSGRVLSIIIMLLGVTLFLRLLRALIVPPDRVNITCKACGLERHDRDAVHCKHCGTIVHIPTKGLEEV
jgi:voltage-gated potassium channel